MFKIRKVWNSYMHIANVSIFLEKDLYCTEHVFTYTVPYLHTSINYSQPDKYCILQQILHSIINNVCILLCNYLLTGWKSTPSYSEQPTLGPGGPGGPGIPANPGNPLAP